MYFYAFRHDISTSHTDPAVKYVMEACIAENDADRHVSNIQVHIAMFPVSRFTVLLVVIYVYSWKLDSLQSFAQSDFGVIKGFGDKSEEVYLENLRSGFWRYGGDKRGALKGCSTIYWTKFP